MRKFLMVPAVAIVMGTAGLAGAASDVATVDAPRDQWLTVAQLAEKLAAQGYDLREIETKKSGYEINFVAKDGRHVEADVHPVTGEILKRKADD